MVGELVFHLGDPKTGSTAIQYTLAGKAYAIQGKRLLYSARTNHIGLAKTLVPRLPGEPRFPGKRFKHVSQFVQLAAALRFSRADTAVVSAEFFENVPPEALKKAIDTWLPGYRDKLRLIAYVRPHAERITSAFAERIKVGLFDGTMEELHTRVRREERLTYTPRFVAWRAVFGDRFTLRPMIRDRLRDRDVVSDFLHFVLGETPFSLTGPVESNASLSMAQLLALREVQGPLREVGAGLRYPRQAFGTNFARILAATLPPEGVAAGASGRPRLHRALAERVAAEYRADAAALDAAFFSDAQDRRPMTDALLASLEQALPAPQSTDIRDYYDAEAIRMFRATGQMLLRIVTTDPGHFTEAVRDPGRRSAIWRGKLALRHGGEALSGLVPSRPFQR